MKKKSLQQTPFSQITATLELLDANGITQEHLKKLRKDPEMMDEIALILNEKSLPLEEYLFHGEQIRFMPRRYNMFGYASYYNHSLK